MREHDTSQNLEDLIPADADAVFLPRDAMAMSHYKAFNDLAVRRRIPMSTPRLDQVEDGVLTGYGFIGREIGRQSASMAHQVLMGTPVADVPVETARRLLESILYCLDLERTSPAGKRELPATLKARWQAGVTIAKRTAKRAKLLLLQAQRTPPPLVNTA